MIDRINLILKAKNITSKQFAEEIGVQASNMSHIMTGRHRPSLDFVMKVVNRYPEIDIKWLTLGVGQMYAPTYAAAPAAPPVVHETVGGQASLFEEVAPVHPYEETEEVPMADAVSAEEVAPVVPPAAVTAPVEEPAAKVADEAAPEVEVQRDENRKFESVKTVASVQHNVEGKRIVKMIILYDDHSFSEYYPE